MPSPRVPMPSHAVRILDVIRRIPQEHPAVCDSETLPIWRAQTAIALKILWLYQYKLSSPQTLCPMNRRARAQRHWDVNLYVNQSSPMPSPMI